ncbi:ABC transporter [Skeletonema marinoi]|uniref:ABC transporter n=1 Tax=Skeletonema marinoi TaxID=267567 RepID=A0AAD9DD10_9STRA|nr:ABC transporter [Skeletonema marinoi]
MVMLEPPQDVLQLLRDALGDSSADAASAANNETEEILAYVATLASSLTDNQNFHSQEWVDALSPYLASLPHLASDETQCEEAVEKFRCAAENSLMQNDDSSDEEDEFGGEQITDIRFSLAYGDYPYDAIQNGKLEGWPVDLRTEYVDSGSNVDPVHEAKIVFTDLQKTSGKSEEDCKAMLEQLKFTPDMMKGTIGELSGGWQMKLRLAQAVLIDADILLLDEPTNHLDTKTVQCHDTPFLEEVVSDVIHYEQRPQWGPHRKLVHYAGKMSAFVKKQPQAKHYFELATTDLKFVFPEPGRLEGIRTSTQPDHDTLGDINLKMTLSSRVCLIGANGAGKTTLVKMIVGDTQPSNPTECRLFIHHNLRVAYVSQHAFYHVEQHIEDSPCSYIQWRFKDGFDKEKIESEAFRITPEEQKAIDDYNLEGIWSRRLRAGVLEYEIKKKHVREKDNIYVSKDELLAMGFKHLLRQTDEKIASKEAGLDLRPVTTSEIQTHLDDFGLAQEFGTYGKIRGLSGGQKVKLVLAAAMWNCPHLLVLDEPTNYLDREALGALSAALNEWGGAVLMISHNKEFYGSVCKEEWIVADGKVDVKGDSDEREMKAVARKKESKKEKSADAIVESAGGNTNADGDKYKDATTNFWGKAVSKKEARNYDKAKKKGDVAAMRKILAIPKGKVMPGQEELGDGK